LDAAGRATRGHITLVAWPRNDVLAQLNVGDEAKLGPAAETDSNSDGSFTLSVADETSLTPYVDTDGTVNFQLVATTSQGSTSRAFARRLSVDRGLASWTSVNDSEPAPETLAIGPTEAVGGTAAPLAADKTGICITTVIANYDLRLDVIGEVYTGAHTTADLKYLSGSSSTLGVGYSVSGAYGSWSQSGTSSATQNFAVDFPTQTTNRNTVFESNFGWQKTRFTCAGQQSYNLRQVEFQGGSTYYTAASAPTANYCTSYVGGTGVTKDTANAITFSNGAKLGSVVGIDLSSKTGFNSSTKISFTFATTGLLCGTDAYPPSASRVVAK
jgi:hypothetical protein